MLKFTLLFQDLSFLAEARLAQQIKIAIQILGAKGELCPLQSNRVFLQSIKSCDIKTSDLMTLMVPARVRPAQAILHEKKKKICLRARKSPTQALTKALTMSAESRYHSIFPIRIL
jgi:hypothetical protein